MADIHYLGEFPTFNAVWKKFPNGGGYGDYVTILGVRHDWDELKNSWGDNPGDVNPALPEVVNHDIDVQGTVTARDGVKTADYIPGEAGAFIDHAGAAEFRSVDVDALRVKDPLIGELLSLPDFIKKYKTELPPDWADYEQIIQFDNVRILAFDPLSQEKFYTTIGALKKLISDSIAAGFTGGGTFDIEILRSDDPEGIPTDNNVFSSLKTLLAIQAAVSPMVGQYISKVENDTAQGIITFLQGIIAAGTSQFVNMIATGKITASNIDVNNTLKADILRVITQAYLQDVILKGQLNSETFTSGFLGEGFRLKNVDGNWVLELDKLVVRKTMEVYEIIVQRIRYQGGQVIHSPAGAKLTAVTDGGSYWKCEHDGTVDFITDAQVLCQNFNVGSRQQNPDGSQTLNNVSVKRYWRRVTSYGTGWFNLSKTDCEAGSGTPEVSDEVVVLGHRNNPDWQNAILIASTGGNTPYIAHYAGINSFSLAGKEVVREGNLQGIVDPDFGQLSGYGLYSKNVYLKGVFRLLSGKTIEEVVSDLDGELSSVTSYVQTEIEAIPGKIKMEVSKVEVGGKNMIRNYDGRFGMDYWSAGAEFVDEQGIAIPITVLSVTAPNPISVYTLDAPTTPETVKLWLDDGSSVNVPVVWGAIDTSVVGEFNIQGTYDLPEGVTGDKPEVILKVVVSANTVVSVTPLSEVTVDQYRTPALPTTIELKLINGAYVSVPVTWGSYNTSQAGTFELTAVYDLPTGVSGYKPTVKVTLVVNAVADTGTFIDVKPHLTNIYKTGTDDWGDWVSPAYGDFNGVLPNLIMGTSKIYIRFREATQSPQLLWLFLNNIPAQQGSISFPKANTQGLKDFTGETGTIREIYWWNNADTIKLYNLEIRNDGSVPPWYIV